MNCITPNCGRPAKCRGVCARCYRVASKLVRTNQATWSALESQGKVLATKRPSIRPVKTWMTEAKA